MEKLDVEDFDWDEEESGVGDSGSYEGDESDEGD